MKMFDEIRLALCDASEPFADGQPFDEQEFVDSIIIPVLNRYGLLDNVTE